MKYKKKEGWGLGMDESSIKCPKCGSSFNKMFLIGKQGNADVCPLCGAELMDAEDNETSFLNEELSFGDDVELGENDSFDEDKIDFWWYEIVEPGEIWKGITFEDGDVSTNCAKCGHFVGSVPYPVARTGDYLLIDSRFRDKCGHCGNELKNHIISKRPESWVDPRKRDMWVKDYENIPKCPTCSSIKIRKISVTSKAASVAMWGVLSRKVHKQWHCDTCGSEW